MVFIFNISLLDQNSFSSELQKVYGLGYNKLFFFKKKLGLNFYNKFFLNSLNLKFFVSNVAKYAKEKNFNFGLNLKQKIYLDIKFHIDLNSYKGFRHKNFFPVRGQNTHNNAKTVKKINFNTLALSL